MSHGIDEVCIFCLRHKTRWEGEETSSCTYGLNHESPGDLLERKPPKPQPKKRSSLCVGCGLHPKNPASATNRCEHVYEDADPS